VPDMIIWNGLILSFESLHEMSIKDGANSIMIQILQGSFNEIQKYSTPKIIEGISHLNDNFLDNIFFTSEKPITSAKSSEPSHRQSRNLGRRYANLC
jgi:hypothetical protein